MKQVSLMSKEKHKLSRISMMHYIKLIIRSGLFLAAFILYIQIRISGKGDFLNFLKEIRILVFLIWLIYLVEMILRFFPSKLESAGCQKQFKKTFVKRKTEDRPKLQSKYRTLSVAVFWFILNSIIGILYFNHIIDAGILILISLAYSVSDMICILFFCPFQTWFMKNKCCTSCRIYNWDYAMMFTPLTFISGFFSWTLVLFSVILLLRWEIAARRYPERFAENTNVALSCAPCEEKLCHHKRQLRGFLEENKNQLQLKGNVIISKTSNKAKKV